MPTNNNNPKIYNKYSFTYINEEKIVTSEITEETSTEVIRSFYYFLLGVSFHKDSVLNAFQEIFNEYKEND